MPSMWYIWPRNQTNIVASDPAVTGSVLMQRFRLFLGQWRTVLHGKFFLVQQFFLFSYFHMLCVCEQLASIYHGIRSIVHWNLPPTSCSTCRTYVKSIILNFSMFYSKIFVIFALLTRITRALKFSSLKNHRLFDVIDNLQSLLYVQCTLHTSKNTH